MGHIVWYDRKKETGKGQHGQLSGIERSPAPGGGGHRGAHPGGGGGRHRQDPDPDAALRVSLRGRGREPGPHFGRHLHKQGRQRDEAAGPAHGGGRGHGLHLHLPRPGAHDPEGGPPYPGLAPELPGAGRGGQELPPSDRVRGHGHDVEGDEPPQGRGPDRRHEVGPCLCAPPHRRKRRAPPRSHRPGAEPEKADVLPLPLRAAEDLRPGFRGPGGHGGGPAAAEPGGPGEVGEAL